MDSTQRNVVFLVHGENMRHVRTVAGMCCAFASSPVALFVRSLLLYCQGRFGTTVDYADSCPTLRNQSELPVLIFEEENLIPSQLLLFKAFFACPTE